MGGRGTTPPPSLRLMSVLAAVSPACQSLRTPVPGSQEAGAQDSWVQLGLTQRGTRARRAESLPMGAVPASVSSGLQEWVPGTYLWRLALQGQSREGGRRGWGELVRKCQLGPLGQPSLGVSTLGCGRGPEAQRGENRPKVTVFTVSQALFLPVGRGAETAQHPDPSPQGPQKPLPVLSALGSLTCPEMPPALPPFLHILEMGAQPATQRPSQHRSL